MFFVLICLSICANIFSQQSNNTIEKEKFLLTYRKYYKEHKVKTRADKTYAECVQLLQNDGKFSDLIELQEKLENQNAIKSREKSGQAAISKLNGKVFKRIQLIAEEFRGKSLKCEYDEELLSRLLQSIVNYGNIEVDRPNMSYARFHTSCFALPVAAVNCYFSLFSWMEACENEKKVSSVCIEAHELLQKIGFQSWTQPYRNDETDKNVVSIERFRHHVWWVGGNALAYRPVLKCAIMMNSIEMIDVISEVAKRGISNVSHSTKDEAFWEEGFTVDGAGWGHGKQCLIWGYPIHGTNAALKILTFLKGSPWGKTLDRYNVDALMNYFSGGAWYFHRGYIPLGLDRGNMSYSAMKQRTIPYLGIINNLLSNWESSFSENEIDELKQLKAEIEMHNIQMANKSKGVYTGTRYFYSNDDLIKKTKDHYVFVNMASSRCYGLESCDYKADGYNFFTNDGMTLFQRDGNEYKHTVGAWNLTAVPGVTSRQGQDKLHSIVNWNGFNSKFNFAAGAANGSDNSAGGFIFEKKNQAHPKDGINDKNRVIYGVKAYKSYFTFGDYMLALGAGINNLDTSQEGAVWTTLNQTRWDNQVTYKTNSKKTIREAASGRAICLKKANVKTDELNWVAQEDGFAYAVLTDETPSEVLFSIEERKTKWDKINGGNKSKKNKTDSAKVFQIWINHGVRVKDQTYGYLVYCGTEAPSKAFKKNPVKVLSNDSGLQAAINKDQTVIGAVIYDANRTIKAPKWEFSVSHPSALLVEIERKELKITLTDAKMDKHLNRITVCTTCPVLGDDITEKDGWYTINIDLATGKFCGKSTMVSVGRK